MRMNFNPVSYRTRPKLALGWEATQLNKRVVWFNGELIVAVTMGGALARLPKNWIAV